MTASFFIVIQQEICVLSNHLGQRLSDFRKSLCQGSISRMKKSFDRCDSDRTVCGTVGRGTKKSSKLIVVAVCLAHLIHNQDMAVTQQTGHAGNSTSLVTLPPVVNRLS
jgi:N12 class adenine-specific DNA methylase